MGFDYAWVHLNYTIPPAIILSLLYRPFFTRIDAYKVLFLVSIAVIATIPWDSYLIRRKIWTYPPNVIIGPTFLAIPAEELFFFVIQTYNTALLYLVLSKPILHPNYLLGCFPGHQTPFKTIRNTGQFFLAVCILVGGHLVRKGGEGTYLGLILVWAGPFALFLWSLAYQFLVALPYTSTALPILGPTLYLWVVDTMALRRGTWAIESGTKLGIHVWEGLEIEEAVFFLATNILVVFGLVAFDNAMAVLLTFPRLFPQVPTLPSPVLLIEALMIGCAKYDLARLDAIKQASRRLQSKSRSFYLASSVFTGRLRIDLIFLYSFCRVADDLVDEASSEGDAREWIIKLTKYLDLAYQSKETWLITEQPDVCSYITNNFPESTQSALRLLPTHILSFGPLYELLEGFKTDLDFHSDNAAKSSRNFPISNQQDLDRYCGRVAGTVGELCLELVFHHSKSPLTISQKENLVREGGRMGVALQLVNIARDIATDAKIGRVYIPKTWLKAQGLQPQDILANPDASVTERFRESLLKRAFTAYLTSRDAISQLPSDARAPIRVAVESYMEIGRVLVKKGYQVREGKATVPRLRRLKVAWKALSQG
ncbi:hypothetical protein BP6252_09065 [Coleophoma cylindrospora]|uniref:Bifunctional lycopene cyclase/phytoene synthase n=1 Tax=Coleophoma cylindrospora TaxID=1849047 RepID=A0A3D8R0V6_9HELO|nr:hypothetical protein BP6252_09065 [Coleophoma cylindrospora]